LLAVFSTALAQGKQVDVKVDPKIDVRVNPKVDVKVNPKINVRRDIRINTDIERNLRVALESIDVQQVMGEALRNLDLDLDLDFNDDNDDDDDRGRSKYEQETQEMEVPLSKPGERGALRVEAHNGRITIKAYDGPTVKVKLIKYGKKVNNDRNNGGMRRVGGGGFNVSAEEYQNNVKIESEGWNNRVDFEIQIPKNFNIKAESYNNGHIWIEGIEGLMEIESYNGPITLKACKGAASASTYNGAVKVEFLDLEPNAPMAFSTYNGDVDLTIPDGAKITAKMKTNKDIYTDFNEFTLSNNKPTRSENRRGSYKIKFENWTTGEVNGGGPEVMMKTTNGNIYIRKNG